MITEILDCQSNQTCDLSGKKTYKFSSSVAVRTGKRNAFRLPELSKCCGGIATCPTTMARRFRTLSDSDSTVIEPEEDREMQRSYNLKRRRKMKTNFDPTSFIVLSTGAGVIHLLLMLSGCSSSEASVESETGETQPMRISSETVDRGVVKSLANGEQLDFTTADEFDELRHKVISRPLNKVIDFGDNAHTQAKLNELSLEVNAMFADIRRLKFPGWEEEFELRLMEQKPMNVEGNAEDSMNGRVDEFLGELRNSERIT